MTPSQKIASLNEYIVKQNNRLTSPPNEKHKDHPEALKTYLRLEIKKATNTIEKLKLKADNK
jgi:hypothetical protein